MDSESGDDVPVRKKRGPGAGNTSRHGQQGMKHLDVDFSLSNYLRDGVFIFKPPELFYTVALPISLHDNRYPFNRAVLR